MLALSQFDPTVRQTRDISIARFAMAGSHRLPTSPPYRLSRVCRDVVCRETNISQRTPAESSQFALLMTDLEIAAEAARDQTKRRRYRVYGLSERYAHHVPQTAMAAGPPQALTIARPDFSKTNDSSAVNTISSGSLD